LVTGGAPLGAAAPPELELAPAAASAPPAAARTTEKPRQSNEQAINKEGRARHISGNDCDAKDSDGALRPFGRRVDVVSKYFGRYFRRHRRNG